VLDVLHTAPFVEPSANDLPGMLPVELREERRARFMAVAEEVSTKKLQGRVGSIMQVLVDSAPGLGKKGGIGRSYADAPEIDGLVRLLATGKNQQDFARWANLQKRALLLRKGTIW
jgi:ribosomal protein S12 methylthiotransferase